MGADQKLYEYACHEGNYSVPIMLRTARMEESGLFDLELSRLKSILAALEFDGNLANNRSLFLLLLN